MLEGEKVRLRAPEPGDRDRVHRWVNDPEVTRYLSMRYPLAYGEVPWLASNTTNEFSNGVRLAIETRDGEHIGAINLYGVEPENRQAALGIIVGEPDFRSKGYGADAIRVLLRFAFEEMNLHRVWLAVIADHAGGIRCYEKCGFREEVRLREDTYKDGRYLDGIIMGVLREQFTAEG